MTLELPSVTFTEDLHTYNWSDVTFTLERFQESGDDIRAELTVTSAHPVKGGQLYFGRLLLMGPRSRSDVRVALERRDPEPDWGGMLEQVVSASLRRYREGAPAVDLGVDDLGPRGRYLVKPFVFDDAVNIIYGNGDSGKSLLCLTIALAVSMDMEVAGLVPERSGTVLYLDWEDSASTHQERLRGLATSNGVEIGANRVVYRRMDASLEESAREVRKDIARFGAVLVIVDSLGMACGGDPSDAGRIIRAMLACRALGVPTIAIHHIAKDAKDKSSPYGSVYASNEARMSWYVQSERNGSSLSMSLDNYKANRGARSERQAFRFDFSEDERENIVSLDVTSLTYSSSKSLGDGGQKWKIAEFLETSPKSTVNEIAAALDLSRDNVRRALNRDEGKLFGRSAAGSEIRWFRLESVERDNSNLVPVRVPGVGQPGGSLKGPTVPLENQAIEEEKEEGFWVEAPRNELEDDEAWEPR